MLTSDQTKSLDAICNIISEEPGIRFCGIINSLGRLIAGGFKQDIIPYVTDEKNRTVYMQLCLELSMRKEYDDLLGPVEYIAAKRKKVTMISIPIQSYFMILSVEPFVDSEKIVKHVMEIFQENVCLKA